MSSFLELQREHANAADFAIIYLEEAHPTDGWLYESVTHLIPQHQTMDARCEAAARLAGELSARGAPSTLPLVVDTLANTASYTYGALPERLVILRHGTVQFIGGKGPEDYSVDEARTALRRLLGV